MHTKWLSSRCAELTISLPQLCEITLLVVAVAMVHPALTLFLGLRGRDLERDPPQTVTVFLIEEAKDYAITAALGHDPCIWPVPRVVPLHWNTNGRKYHFSRPLTVPTGNRTMSF